MSANEKVFSVLLAPRVSEVFVGLESRIGSWRLRGLGYHRSERDLPSSTNVGAPLSAKR